jgi:hypothetical protein
MARIREVQELGAGKESDTSPLIQRLLQFRDSSTNEPLSMETVVAETVSHLQAVYFQAHNRHADHHLDRIAGSETSSTTLAYLLWELTCSPDIMQKLQTEVDGIMPDGNREIPDLSVLQALPYMTAFIQEGVNLIYFI